MLRICIILFFTLSGLSAFSAGNEHLPENYEERVFVKTDKSLYISGEIIWYSVRLYDGVSGSLSDKHSFVYIELLDSLNNSVVRHVAEVKNGGGSGSILIPTEVLSGYYFLRAYTMMMKNYGPDAFFHKPLTIVNTFKPLVQNKKIKYALEVKPEGGSFAAGLPNKVSVILRDQFGQLRPFVGMVTGSSGDTAAILYGNAGYDEFNITADNGERYAVQVFLSDGETIVKHISADRTKYVSMITEESEEAFSVDLYKGNSATGNYQLKLLHQNKEVVTKDVVWNNQDAARLMLVKSAFPKGIAELQLTDGKNVLASRLLYNNHEDKSIVPEINLNRTSFEKRETVEMDIRAGNSNSKGKLLIYVIREDVPEDEEFDYYRLVASEIKGLPGNMISDAYRKGILNKLLVHAAPAQTAAANDHFFKEEIGKQRVSISVKDKAGNPVKGANVYLSRRSTAIRLYGGKTDNNGNIELEIIPDYANKELIIQTDGDYNIEVASPYSNKFADIPLPEFRLLPEWESYIREASINLQVEMSFNASRWNNFADPVADSSAFYHTPDYFYYLDDYKRFPSVDETITEFIFLGRVRKQDKKRTIHLFDLEREEFLKDPLILLDGVPVFDPEQVLDYDPYRIKRIDIINSRYFYGPFVFSGIISFRTFTGRMDEFNFPAHVKRISYEQPELLRLFNNIQYREGLAYETLPDNRNILLWQEFEDADFSGPVRFSTSDLSGNYKVVAEITYADGRTATAYKTIQVN